MAKIRSKKSKIRTTLYNHIINNKREYLIVTILFFIGIIIGIIYFNNSSEEILIETDAYLNKLYSNIKQNETVDLFEILKESIRYNLIITILLWFGASTIIGIPIVYGTVILKGFSISYTICSILIVFGMWNGALMSVSFMLLHNILFIPVMFAISVSGVKLYNSIMKNRQRENVKLEILRHTIFCFIMLLCMIIAALIETYISTNLAIAIVKNINF